MLRRFLPFIIVVLFFINHDLTPQNVPSKKSAKRFLPSHFRVQYAGNIGMISGGPAWSLFQNRLEIATSIGFVPESSFQSAIYITSLKGIYTPGFDIRFKRLIIKPIAIGLAFSHHMGRNYNRYQNTDLFPKNYYWWKVPYRFALLYQSEIYIKINKKYIEGFSFFFEASIWDLNLYSYIVNQNSSYLNIWDITTFGLGSKFYF